MSRFGKDSKPLKFGEEYTVKSVTGGIHRVGAFICAEA